MQAWLAALATRGAVDGQQMLPEITTLQVVLQVQAVAFRYYW